MFGTGHVHRQASPRHVESAALGSMENKAFFGNYTFAQGIKELPILKQLDEEDKIDFSNDKEK